MRPEAARAWSAGRPAADHSSGAACHAPWVSLELDPQGWVYTCCANQQYPLGRIGRDRLSELWAGPRQQVLRDAMRRWDLSVGCGACRWHLEHGRLDPDAAVYDRYGWDPQASGGPASITFALSNRCNLGCVMCNGELSSVLRARAGHPPLVPPYDDQFFEDLTPMLPSLQYAKFLGGEPFLIPEHWRVWDLMAEVGGPPRFQVTTNATVWTDRVEQLLATHVVDVTVSLDAVDPAVFEGIRRGASAATVRCNLERFASSCAASGSELRICSCLMVDNWAELAPLVRLANQLGAALSVNVVSDPGLALHDLSSEQLSTVAHLWSSQEADGALEGVRPDLMGVWATQRAQLESVLADRRNGVVAAPRHAHRAVIDLPGDTSDGAPWSADAPTDVATHRRRLQQWGDGPVARVELDADHTVAVVLRPHPRLGLDAALVGLHAQRLVEVIERADGRPAWLAGDELVEGARVVTLVLCEHRPERGSRGSLVRLVLVRQDEGTTVLVAEDRIYDRAPAVPVELGRGADGR